MQGTAQDQGELGTTFAGGQAAFDLVTRGDDQYVAFYDAGCNVVVGHRKVDKAWTLRTLWESGFNPSDLPSFKNTWDDHRYLKCAVDGSGNVHVIGDMHANVLRYWRTSRPGDLSTLKRYQPMSAGNDAIETKGSYATFISRSNGNLGWMIFRDGSSGNGDVYVYEWNNTTKTWVNNGKIADRDHATYFTIDGKGSMYYDVFASLDGWFHIVFNWRETGDAWTNSKLSYMRTRDFKSYQSAQGVAINLPLTGGGTRRPVIDMLPTDVGDNGFVNNETQWITMGNYVVIAYRKMGRDSTGAITPQVWVARANLATGSDWTIAQLTQEPGGIWGLSNHAVGGYLTIIDIGVLATDFSSPAGRRRVTFPLEGFETVGPRASVPCPPYYPAEVYAQGGAPLAGFVPAKVTSANLTSDSRPEEQVHGFIANRNYVASRPAASTSPQRQTYPKVAYVLSWMAGPSQWAIPSPAPSAADQAKWPRCPVRLFKITY